MPSHIQRSFAGGELAPSLYARADQVKYQSGLHTCHNFMVMRHGGVTNRPGTKLIALAKDSANTVRLMKFVFNAEQTYVLEFGHLYIRFYRNGIPILNAGGSAPYEVVSPYQSQHLRDIRFTQSGDVMTLVHPSYAPRQLSRTAHNVWTLAEITYKPSVNPPPFITASATTSNTKTQYYVATSVKEITYEESLPSSEASIGNFAPTTSNPTNVTIGAVTGIYEFNVYKKKHGVFGYVGTAKAPFAPRVCNFAAPSSSGGSRTITITLPTGHGYDVGEKIIITEASNSTYNGQWDVTAKTDTSATFTVTNASGSATSGSATVNFNAVFVDDGIAPDLTDTPPQDRNPFEGGNYPSTVGYFQQRAIFANTTAEPEKVWMSRPGNFKNFTIRSPLQDDDAITFTIAGNQVNEVRHLVEVGTLLILTAGGEWRVLGDSDGVVRPSAINLKQEGYSGAANLPPIVIGNNALYVQARGNIARDLRYDLQSDGYNGRDLTVFAAHLFDGYTLSAWDYAQIPHSVVWTVRSDGTLLGLTYLREHDVWGWHRHSTDGVFEDVLCIPEGTEDAVYVVVKRTLNGQATRCIERFASRYTSQKIDIARDAFFVDCGGTYDGRNSDTAKTLTLTQDTGLTVQHRQTLTANVNLFASTDVGNAFELSVGSTTLRFKVVQYVSATVVKVTPSSNVPATGFTGIASSTWTKLVDEIAGLTWLNGKEVAILADGNVHPRRTVASGSITLDRPCGVVHVGLPYQSTLKTLPVDVPNAETMSDKNKLIGKVALMVESSRGVFVGPDESNLREFKQRKLETYGQPTGLVTGLIEVQTVSQWDKNGQVTLVQADPLPVSVLSVVPSMLVAPR